MMCSNSAEYPWQLIGATLVVDDEPVVAEACAARLEAVGCRCLVAGSYSEALELLGGRPDIGLVITDHSVDSDNTEEFVTALRAHRPGIVVVGSSGTDCRAELQHIGVDRFLLKPWRVEELMGLLSGRIEKCVMCAVALPLRQPFAGEVGQRWACASCGCLYRAMLDHDAAPETFHHLHRLE